MAQFDTSTIEGFDGMSAEQKLEALLKADIPDKVDLSLYVSKETFDKKASEAASLSKQLKESKEKLGEIMSEDEKKKLETEEANKKILEELETLRKDKTVSEYTAKYLALGYDSELAADTAKAMADGDMTKVFANGEKHRAALEKSIKENLMKNDPKPGSGGGDNGDSKGVELAKKIGKAKSEANKAYEDVMKHYLR